jgi:uncharacterized protein
MYALHVIAFILLIVGGLNWGLVGLVNFNIVERIFSHIPAIARIIFVIVGLAGIYAIVFFNGYIRPELREHMGGHTPHTT